MPLKETLPGMPLNGMPQKEHTNTHNARCKIYLAHTPHKRMYAQNTTEVRYATKRANTCTVHHIKNNLPCTLQRCVFDATNRNTARDDTICYARKKAHANTHVYYKK